NLVWGLGGMINLGLAGFYAVGAYATALLATRAGWPDGAALLAATLAACAIGAGVALLTARLRGDYLAIVTLGFAEVLRLAATNEMWLTHGADGISNIPAPGRAGLTPFGFEMLFFGLVWGAVLLLGFGFARLSGSPFGRVLRAIREDETVAQVAGKRTLRFKVQAFALGAGVSGLAGGLYAQFNGYVAPDAFGPLVTIYVVLAVVAGGTGRMTGAVLGAVLVTALTEGTRFLGALLPFLHPVQIASVREGVIGLALIGLLHLRPEGVLPERVRLHSPP
ncbi:MAG TPA: branched-chain amino acid ABC transporter permease, partial [Acetobacteraceae bacterium]|nr:branched-chain amino acid ABC transporter permease [Acetobacteraceae bacterium]